MVVLSFTTPLFVPKTQCTYFKYSCLSDDGREPILCSSPPSPSGGDDTILTLDVGTSSTKAAIYYPRSQTLQTIFRHPYATTSLPGMHITQDICQWTDAVINASKQALAEIATPPIAISITGQMQDLIAVGPDAPDLLRSEAILYSDARAVAEAEELSQITGRKIPATSLLAKLKLLPKPTASLDYTLLFGAADYVTYHLTESHIGVSDATTAATTSLTLPPFHRVYDTDLLKQCRLAEFIPHLPPILPRLHALSAIHPTFADILDLPYSTKIIHAGGDALSATLGALGDYVYAGTSGWVGVTRMAGEYSLHLANGDIDEEVISVGSVASVGDCIRRTCDMLGVHVEDVDETVMHTPIGSNGVVFIPYITTRRCPPSSKPFAGWYGVSATTKQADLVRATVEGVVYALAVAAAGMKLEISAFNPLVIGGGAASCSTFVEGICSVLGEGNGVVRQELGLLGAGWVGAREMGLGGELLKVKDDERVQTSEKERELWMRGKQKWENVACRFEGIDDA